jgi:hypothetical protein
MRTPKIEALHRTILWFNINKNTDIKHLDLDLSPIDSNSWLAGFTGSKSSFTISPPNKNHTRVLKYKFSINFVIPNTDLKEWYESTYFLLFSKISEYLNTSFITKIVRTTVIKYTFIIFVYYPQSYGRLIEYFNKYPLKGNNALDYEQWCSSLSDKYRKVADKNKEVTYLKIQLQNKQIILRDKSDNSLSKAPGYTVCKRNFSTSCILRGKVNSNTLISTCTDLVVGREILPSGVGWGRHTKQERNIISIPPYLYSVIVGLLL